MDSEAYTFALKNTLNEIRNVCPDITNTFMFRENCEIIAGDENTSKKAMTRVVNAFAGILEKAASIGGVESITIEGSNRRVNVSHISDTYFVTIASGKADMNHANTVTRILIPTVLKLLEKICPTPLKNSSHLTKKRPVAEPSEEIAMEEPKETEEPEIKPEPLLPEPPVTQLLVENLGGLLVASDTVRVDGQILSQWEDFHERGKIEEVEIETFDGKTTRCKVKPIKESKYERKGTIQMPEKIQLALEIRKGELVRVKPIIE